MMIITHSFATSLMYSSSEKMFNRTTEINTNSDLLRNIMDAAYERSSSLAKMIHVNSPEELEALSMDYHAADVKFKLNREKFSKQTIDENLSALLKQQDDLAKEVIPYQNEIYRLVKDGKSSMAMHIFFSMAMPLQDKIYSNTNKMSEYQFSSSKKKYKELKQNNKSNFLVLLILGAASIVLSLLLTKYVLRKQEANEHQLSVTASTDNLTQLPNRSTFISNVSYQIDKFPDKAFTILFIDIDYFKSINDNFGHSVGDEVLKSFATIIQKSLQPNDILSRFGGDEFVVLLSNQHSQKHINTIANELSNALDTSLQLFDKDIFISASIGSSIYLRDGNTAQELLENADIAMYSAKQAGRNCYKFFSDESKSIIENEHIINQGLKSIFKNNNQNQELYLQYQPLHNINEGNVTECEALIRWKTKDGNNILPDEFIHLAEKSNLIEKINRFVIKQACKQQHDWQKSGITNMRININLSGNKHSFKTLLSLFEDFISDYGLKPEMFGIELTERTILDVSEQTIDELNNLRNAGMKISIDDFGTGYSSLSYLKKLPITTIKIDKSFTSGLPECKDDFQLIKTIITLGHSLNLDVVAEGVETYEQLKILKQNNCDIAQGYYLYRPVNHTKFSQFKLVA